MCDCITSEEKCLLNVSVTAPSLSRAPIVTSATAGTPPQSARSLQVCVQQIERGSLGHREIEIRRKGRGEIELGVRELGRKKN